MDLVMSQRSWHVAPAWDGGLPLHGGVLGAQGLSVINTQINICFSLLLYGYNILLPWLCFQGCFLVRVFAFIVSLGRWVWS